MVDEIVNYPFTGAGLTAVNRSWITKHLVRRRTSFNPSTLFHIGTAEHSKVDTFTLTLIVVMRSVKMK